MIVVFYELRTRIGAARLLNGRIAFDLPLDVAGYLLMHGVAGYGRIVHTDEPELFLTCLPSEFRSPYLRAVMQGVSDALQENGR